jgi:hypothetical protein
MRVTAKEYEGLDLRAHAFLAGVPLHDAWAIDLPGGGPDRTMADVRHLMSGDRLRQASRVANGLFRVRAWLGRLFGWDREPRDAPASSFVRKLTPADRENSLVKQGTRDGPFKLLYMFPRESLSEVQNATVHAFSVSALVRSAEGYRLYWTIYVRPTGRLTIWYMRLINPFRRWFLYPVLLRQMRNAWAETDWGDETSGIGGISKPDGTVEGPRSFE